MEDFVTYLIYIYMFICVMVLLYNFIYIFGENERTSKRKRKMSEWKIHIRKRIKVISDTYIDDFSDRKMEKELKKFNSLIAFNDAINAVSEEFSEEDMRQYYECGYMIFQTLVFSYIKKDSMERAYVAYLISKYRPCNGEVYRPIMEYLISYLDDSTIYCRENVLNALYALGNPQSVENAFQIINDRNLFHHQKLLSDGLMKYTGDKEALAKRLWGHFGKWNSNLMISVAQFINNCSEQFAKEFLDILKDTKVDLEIRIVMLRYFRKHYYEPAYEMIINILNDEYEMNGSLAIVAASVLGNYPSGETVEVLEQSLSSRNWYVRYNAASSLMVLELSKDERDKIVNGEDRYAAEILKYMEQLKQAQQESELAGGNK